MPLFTYITGIIAILGFILQLRDVFPAHREIRKAILYLVTGASIGSIVASLQGIQVNIQTPGNILVLIGYIALAILVIIMTIAAIAVLATTDPERRNSLNDFLGGTFTAFLIVGSLLAIGPGSVSTDYNDITIDELILLSNNYASQKNYDRAIDLLDKAYSKVDRFDPRDHLLNTRIQELKKEQVSISPSPAK